MDRLEHALARAHRRKTSLTMVFLDLIDFKVINDSLDHNTGDRLLEEVGRRLDSAARSSGTVARLGGGVRRLTRGHWRRKGSVPGG